MFVYRIHRLRKCLIFVQKCHEICRNACANVINLTVWQNPFYQCKQSVKNSRESESISN